MRSTIDYLIIGHMTADLTPKGRRLGGTVSYASRTAHAFGLKVGVLTSAAADEPLLDEIRPYAEVVVVEAGATSTFENIYTPEGRKQYIRSVAAPLTYEYVPQEWRAAPLVHLAPLTDEVDHNLAFAFPDGAVLVTLQGWLRRWGDDGLVRFKRWYDEAVIEALNYIVFSVEDIVEAPELEAEYARIAQNLIVTRADKGGVYYKNGQPYTYTTPHVEEIQPTGAGDVFAGALLAGLYRLNSNVHAALDLAARMAAICVTRHTLEGTPTPDEVREALAKIKND